MSASFSERLGGPVASRLADQPPKGAGAIGTQVIMKYADPVVDPSARHASLVAGAVDSLDATARLEAAGFSDAMAREYGFADVYHYARTLPTGSTSHRRAVRSDASPRAEGWLRAVVLLSGALIVALAAANLVQIEAVARAVVPIGLAGWITGNLVGAVAWRRFGLAQPADGARRSAALAILAVPAAILLVLAMAGDHRVVVGLIALLWLPFVAAQAMTTVFGRLRVLAALTAACLVAAGTGHLAGARWLPGAALVALAVGTCVLATASYRRTTSVGRRAPRLPDRRDLGASAVAAVQAALFSAAVVVALYSVGLGARIPLSLGLVIAAALCDPLVVDFAVRLRALTRRSSAWSTVRAGVIARTLTYLALAGLIAGATTVTVAVALDHRSVADAGRVSDDVAFFVIAPALGLFTMATAMTLRAGRAMEAVRLAGLCLIGILAVTHLSTALGAAVLTACVVLTAARAIDTTCHPRSW